MKRDLEEIRNESISPTTEERELLESRDPEVQRRIRRLSILWLTDNTSRILPKIFSKKHIYLQLLWTVFFIISGTISLALVIKYVRDYLEYKVNTNIGIIYESPASFPAVTFCNLNPFNKVRAQKYADFILSENNLSYINKLSYLDTSAINLTMRAQDLLSAALATKFSIQERKSVGFDIDEMLISCTFNGISCNLNNFSWTQSYYYGNCYTFNSGKDLNSTATVIQQTTLSGINSGLQIEVFVGDPYLNNLFNYKSGLLVVIHNQTIKPFIDLEGVEVPTGAETNIAVKRIFMTKLGEPYNKCKAKLLSPDEHLNSTLYRTILQEFNTITYRQRNCFNLCYQRKIIDDCNCTDPKFVYPVFNTTNITIFEPCQNTTQMACLSASFAQFQNNPISDECSQYCPLECVSISYSTSLSSAYYPTKTYSNWLALQNVKLKKLNSSSYEDLRSSLVKLNVYYEDMSYKTITESPALTWDTLLGNIGGMLSLFIGVSIMTIGEFLELILELVRIGFFSES